MALPQANLIVSTVCPVRVRATKTRRHLIRARNAQQIAGPSLTVDFEKLLFESLDKCIDANTLAIATLNTGVLDRCEDPKLLETIEWLEGAAALLTVIVELGKEIRGNPDTNGLSGRLAILSTQSDHLLSIAEGIRFGLDEAFCGEASAAVSELRQELAHA